MNIVLKRCPTRKSRVLRRIVRNKLASALHRTAFMVMNISVYLADVNGPKGGRDKSCKLVINTIYGEKIVIKDVKSSWQAAVSSAVRRGQNTMTRLMDKFKNEHVAVEA